MLQQTFRHIKGVGQKTEILLWKLGIRNWEDFIRKLKQIPLTEKKKKLIVESIKVSIKALKKGNIKFFYNNLNKPDWWRLYPEFLSRTAFLDIETTGLSPIYNDITIIGILDESGYKVYFKGHNMKKFLKDITKYSIIVTFNGSRFDLPFLKKKFPKVCFPPVHIDLKYLVRRVGLWGDLKKIEKELGIRRPKVISRINGYYATVLWNRFLRGDGKSLELLIRYNYEDTFNLRLILDKIYPQLVKHVNKYSRNEQKISFNPRQKRVKILVHRKNTHSFSVRIGKKQYRINLQKAKTNIATINTVLRRLRKKGNLPIVIGVDLSASARRASGLAVLKGKDAIVTTAKTDMEIINYILKYRPAVVSIDSPLGVPRRKSEIMRKCEKELRKRGIPVFPCLLPSMKKLTKRGIRIKTSLMRKRLHVIECYPGAAQDILRITRKKVSVTELLEGLKNFGIHIRKNDGTKVTHHELDAVTSAIVGYFYLTGMYEALGDKKESKIIIPRFSI
jgi:uncharacterized protein YprB with RNaseH-like and TPR domain/predicted nuclease with RNAse H fold